MDIGKSDYFPISENRITDIGKAFWLTEISEST